MVGSRAAVLRDLMVTGSVLARVVVLSVTIR